MANQDGLRFLFDIQDKISAKLAKIEAKAKSSAAKIDKAFTRASKSQQDNTAKAVASEQRRVVAVEKSHAKAVALLQRESAARSRSTAKSVANEQKRIAAVEKSHARANALRTSEATKATQAANRTSAAQIKAEQKRIVAVEKSHTKAVTLLKRESDEFKRSMGRMAAAASVAFAAVAGKAIQMAGGYDLAMRSVQAKTGATGALMDRLSEQSREMGRTTVHSATEAARGQAFLAQAGFDANEVLEALPATLALATAGELDLASAADIASNVLSGFRLETEQTGRVADVLASIASKTNTNISQMGEALSKAAPAAAAAGWSLEETAAAIGRLSDAGIQGEEAGTVLKTMLARLAAPTGKLAALMTEVGVNVTDATGKMLPLNDIIEQLAPHADNTGLMFELLGTRGANAGLVLGALGDKNLRDLTSELENSEGAAQQMADIMSGGLWGSIKAIQSIIESAYISFGKRFTPAVQTLAKLFAKLPAPIQEVVVVVGSLAGAMGGLMIMMPGVFGAITRLPGKLIALNTKIGLSTWSVKGLTLAIKNAWRALMGPVGWVIAIGAATVALGLFWRESQKAENKMPRLAAQIDALTRRIEEQGEATPRQTTRLRKLTEAHEELTLSTSKATLSIGDLSRAAKAAEEAIAAETAATSAAAEVAAAAAAATVAAEQEAAQVIVDIEAAKRMAIVQHIQLRNDAERAANDARVQMEADAAQAIVDIEAAKRRAIVLHIQKRKDKVAAAEAQAAIDAATAYSNSWMGQFRDVVSPDNIGQTIARAFEGAGGFWGAIKSLASQAASVFTDSLGGWLSKGISSVMGSVFSSATPVLASSALNLGTAMGGTMGAAAATSTGTSLLGGLGSVAAAIPGWGWAAAGVAAAVFFFKGWGGPSKSEQEARKLFAGFHEGVVATLGDTQEFIDEVQVATGAGWDRTLAETRAAFIVWGTDAGLTYDQAFYKYGLYQKAVSAGNTTLMKQLEEEFEGYRQSAEDANAAAAKAAEDAAAKSAAAWEKAMSATMSAYTSAKDAGIRAYDEVYAAAIESGAGQEEAANQAANAQQEASDKILREERDKYIQLAKFEAILAEIRAGNVEGALAAGEKAAADTELAWDLSLGHIADADELATGDRITNATTVADHSIDESDRSTGAIVNDIESIPTTRTFEIEYHGTRTGQHGGVDIPGADVDVPGRQHGGPVLAGHRYRVGERGPEDFIPSRSGRIEPNGSSGSGVDAKALAKAVADALEGTRVDVDGRQLGRLVVRHQPLAVAELGGRR